MRRPAFALLTIALLTAGYFVYNGPLDRKLARWKSTIDHKVEIELIADAKGDIKRQLKDPYSAKWGVITASRDTLDSNSKPFVCGNVNSKNGFGAYGGMQQWIYHYDASTHSYSADFMELMDSLHVKYCMARLLDTLHRYSWFATDADSL
jgi:hypothetical protein